MPLDINKGKEDVYEYEPMGVGSCEAANTEGGCVALITSGESDRESTFLDASESGNDVFFLTSAKLVPQATESGYDIYDARVCGVSGRGSVPAGSDDGRIRMQQRILLQIRHGCSTVLRDARDRLGERPRQPCAAGGRAVHENCQARDAHRTAEKLAAAIKACRKDKKKSKRKACEASAHKRFTVRKATRRARASRRRTTYRRSGSRRMTRRSNTRLTILLTVLAAALALLASAGAEQALAAAGHWDVIARTAPTRLQPGHEGEALTVVVNLGDAPIVGTATDPIEVAVKLPEGIAATFNMAGEATAGAQPQEETKPHEAKTRAMRCSSSPLPHCTFIGEIPPYVAMQLDLPVRAESSFQAGNEEVTVTGGGVLTQPVSQPIEVSPEATPFGVESLELNAEEEDGSSDLQAGSHPFQLTTTLNLNEVYKKDPAHPELSAPATPALLKNLDTTLPAGLVGDPLAVPTCSATDFSTLRLGDSNTCPGDTAVGVAIVTFKEPVFAQWDTEAVPVFNLVPARGEPARFGFEFDKVPVTLDTAVRHRRRLRGDRRRQGRLAGSRSAWQRRTLGRARRSEPRQRAWLGMRRRRQLRQTARQSPRLRASGRPTSRAVSQPSDPVRKDAGSVRAGAIVGAGSAAAGTEVRA